MMWQVCPLCAGLESVGGYVCPVCKGKKIIHELTGKPPQ